MTREVSIAASFIAVAPLVALASCALGQPAVNSDQTASPPGVAAIDGEALFMAPCKSCHEPALERAPDHATLATLARSAIVAQLTDGAMAPMSKGLSEREIDAIAAYLAPATTGKVQWKTYVITEPLRALRLNGVGIPMQGPAGAAIWSGPPSTKIAASSTSPPETAIPRWRRRAPMPSSPST